MTSLYFAGAEAASHRKLLLENGAQDVSMSFIGLTRRIKNLQKWGVQKHFPGDVNVFLDSGSFSINRAEEKFTMGELHALSNSYQEFITNNLDAVDLVSEFDALPLGKQFIEDSRTNFYDDLPRDKFMPIWHFDNGLEELNNLADKYQNIGITSTTLSGRNLAPVLNRLSARGVRLHGVGITDVEDLYQIDWSSVSSTSWIAPQRNGETHIWVGRSFKRYSKNQKDAARKKYRTYLQSNGFDSELIESGDYRELLKLSIWSWTHLMEDVSKKAGDLSSVTTHDSESGMTFVESTGEVVDKPVPETRKSLSTTDEKKTAPVEHRETVTLPVLGVTRTTEVVTGVDGENEEIEKVSYNVRSESTRLCRHCFLASKCPAFEQNSNCAFNIPIEIKTKDELHNMQNSLVEMQAQRVLFMRFAEEMEGGYADPNLSSEMDRLQKMIKAKNDLESDSITFKMEGKATGEAAKSGMLARLFGDQASERVRALPEPISADEAILDAEIVQDWKQV